jgi:glucose-1-phosphate adenylyltransferase
MGNYIFDAEVLTEALGADAKSTGSSHDFGRDILPALIEDKKVYAYNFENNRVPLALEGEEPSYWRDVGTIDSYYNANMDLRAVSPSFNLYNWRWPIRTLGYGGPPPKFVFDEKERRGVAINSIVAEGTIISGSHISGSVIGQNVRVHSYCHIEDSILLDWAEIGRGCRIRRAIIDKYNIVLPGTEIGYNVTEDRERYFVSEAGVVVIPRAAEKKTWVHLSSQA